jgi:hypothetical protein
VFRDHVELGDGKAAIGIRRTHATCFVCNQGYVMAQMGLEIETAGGDLEKAAGVILYHGVVAIRAT